MSKAEVKCKSLSHVQLFVTSWIVACRAPLSMEFSRQEYWSGSHSHLQGIFPTLESNLGLPHCRQILYCLSHQGTPKVCVAGRQKLGNGGIKLVKSIWENWAEYQQYLLLCSDSWRKGNKEQVFKLFPCVHACVLCCFSRVQLFLTLWTLTRQAPLYMGFSRREYWSGLPYLPPGAFPDPGVEYTSLALAGGFLTTSTTWEAPKLFTGMFNSEKFL